MTRGVAREGLTLIEVLVALTILGLASVACAGLSAQGMETVVRTHDVDAETQRASAVLDRVAHLPSSQLRARLGRTVYKGFLIDLSPAGASVLDVTVSDSTGRVLLSTSVQLRGDDAVR